MCFTRSLSALSERFCFLLVDKYEPEGPLARLLKFLILFVAGVAAYRPNPTSGYCVRRVHS